MRFAYLEEGTEHFHDYVQAVEWAQRYAMINRRHYERVRVGYRWVDGNHRVRMMRTEHTNEPGLISQQRLMTSVNTALEVDLALGRLGQHRPGQQREPDAQAVAERVGPFLGARLHPVRGGRESGEHEAQVHVANERPSGAGGTPAFAGTPASVGR